MILAESSQSPRTHTHTHTHARTEGSEEQLERRIPAQLMHNKEREPNQTISKQAGKVKQNSSSRCCEAPNTGAFSPDPGPPLPRDGSTTRPTWPASPEQTLITERLIDQSYSVSLPFFSGPEWKISCLFFFVCLLVFIYFILGQRVSELLWQLHCHQSVSVGCICLIQKCFSWVEWILINKTTGCEMHLIEISVALSVTWGLLVWKHQPVWDKVVVEQCGSTMALWLPLLVDVQTM